MLSDIIGATNLTEEFCANLVGASRDHFREWMSGERPVPRFLIPELVSVFGATREQIRGVANPDTHPAGSIWFKLREENKVNKADLEMIGITRKLCFRIGQFFALQGLQSDAFSLIFEQARAESAAGRSPEVQGRLAARFIRKAFGWAHGNTGIGDAIRPNLRQKGIVVVESAFRDAVVEGCSFLTEGPVSQMVCLFVNVYGVTWFRRNAVLLHEMCHAIFDLGQREALAIDYRAENEGDQAELRAQAFARECLVPKEVLAHYKNQIGFDWMALTPRALAQLIAGCHAPQQMILKAALDYGLIDYDNFVSYSQYECAALLEEFTTHGLTTKEYAERLPLDDKRKWVLADRTVRFGDRKLLLPSNYVGSVITSVNAGGITVGKAAELTLMSIYDFRSRFASFIEPHQD